MSKHTPGPWEIHPKQVTYLGSGSSRLETWEIDSSKVTTAWVAHALELSDARLIAAAPEMLEALKMFAAYRESGMGGSSSQKAQAMRAEVHDAIEAAIAKAEGRS